MLVLVSVAVLMVFLAYLARLGWASHRAGFRRMDVVARSGAPGIGRGHDDAVPVFSP